MTTDDGVTSEIPPVNVRLPGGIVSLRKLYIK